MHWRLAIAALFLVLSHRADAQSETTEPHVEVSVLPGHSPPAGASVRAFSLLADAKTQELLRAGFPAALRFRLELWRASGLFDELEDARQWDVLVRFDPYSNHYQLVRRGNRDTEVTDGLQSIADVEVLLRQATPILLSPRRPGTRYYYQLNVDVETLSVSDLDELQRWLRGEFEPAVRGKRAPLSALRRGLGTLLSRLLGGENRHYLARTPTFGP